MANDNWKNFFSPASLAIVGATDGIGKVGTVITKNILEQGYKGKVFLVNPGRKELYGRQCYATIKDIGEEIDLAVIVIPAPLVNEVIKQAANQVKNFIVISAGFSEIAGEEGKKREEELKAIAQENKLNILGPNCLGLINPSLKLNATFAGGMPQEGNIGLISQSGALVVAILDIFAKNNLGFSKVFSIGNKMQLGEVELIEYLGNEAGTKVIGLYLEGIKNGQEFMKVASRVSKLKPIVILKAGKTEKAQKAISSHTGALACSEAVAQAIFKKCGIIEAENIEEFINLLYLLSLTSPPLNNSAVVVTNAGGAGVLTTDAFKDKEIKLAELSEKVKEKIRLILPEAASAENPIDVLGDAHEDRYENVLKILGEENIGAFICVLTPQEQTPVIKIAEKIISFADKGESTVITSFIGGEKVKSAIKNLEKNNIPNFFFPEQAVKALDSYYHWKIYQSEKVNETEIKINLERRKKVETIIQKARAEKRKALLFSETVKVMKAYQIQTVETWSAETGKLVRFPAVVKVDSDKVLHKTDKQGVILNIKDRNELMRAIEKMKSLFPGNNLIIQPMLERQTELIIGIKRDETFGPVMVLGLGGIYTEIFKMVDFLAPPFNAGEVEKFLAKSKIGFLFKETRGKEPFRIREVAKIVEHLGVLAQENPEIKEFDINPLLVYNDGREATAVDVKIII